MISMEKLLNDNTKGKKKNVCRLIPITQVKDFTHISPSSTEFLTPMPNTVHFS